MPTHKQFKLLEFIRQQILTTGVSPSFQEMAEAVGLKSKSNIFRLIEALEKQKLVRRVRQTARSIEVIRWPKDPIENEPN